MTLMLPYPNSSIWFRGTLSPHSHESFFSDEHDFNEDWLVKNLFVRLGMVRLSPAAHLGRTVVDMPGQHLSPLTVDTVLSTAVQVLPLNLPWPVIVRRHFCDNRVKIDHLANAADFMRFMMTSVDTAGADVGYGLYPFSRMISRPLSSASGQSAGLDHSFIKYMISNDFDLAKLYAGGFDDMHNSVFLLYGISDQGYRVLYRSPRHRHRVSVDSRWKRPSNAPMRSISTDPSQHKIWLDSVQAALSSPRRYRFDGPISGFDGGLSAFLPYERIVFSLSARAPLMPGLDPVPGERIVGAMCAADNSLRSLVSRHASRRVT